MRFVWMTLALCLLAGCVDKEAEAKKKADAQRAFMEAEARARDAQEAAEQKQALEEAQASCAASKAEGCVALGRIHLDGRGVPKDRARAAEAFAQACALKSKDGCRFAAEHEQAGRKKLQHLKALCGLEDLEGCMAGAVLADELVKAGELPEPKKMAARDAVMLLDKACTLGDARACTARGLTLVQDDPAQALASFSRGCDQNEPTSCWQLGLLLRDAKGAKKKDLARAAEALKKACDAGLQDACPTG
jgi:TPR repeat protein